ncbi:endothelin-converting enzyme 1-like [Condylostylus longicornis]|uniref:endothelin-converting enzyme 1-like n=1 Tax=Condylostylus longicornis TaxID=2530218 RepID=UPI00244DE7E8|nr:endothelin-converting enzyme 1-like [Condylostylus longicornis]
MYIKYKFLILLLKFSIISTTPLKSSSPDKDDDNAIITSTIQSLQPQQMTEEYDTSDTSNKSNNQQFNNDPINIEKNQKLFKDYIDEIKSHLNPNLKPCDNFIKYACGNFDGISLNDKKISTDKFYIEDFILLNKISKDNRFEVMASNFYLSCKNNRKLKQVFEEIDSLKTIGKWPIMEDDLKYNISDKDIAKLWGELAILKAVDLLEMTMTTVSDQIYFSSKLNEDNFTEIQETMNELNKNGNSNNNQDENIQLAIEEIQNFTILISDNLLQLPPNSDESVTIDRVSSLNETITNFDWTEYFQTFSKLMNLNINYFDNKSVELRNPNAMQKIIDLIKQTESRIVLNYLIWKYIKFAKNMKCEEFQPFWRPVILTKLWKEYYTQIDKDNLLKIYNQFEKSFNDVKHQLNEPSQAILNHVIYPSKNLLENFDKILSYDSLNNYYSQFKIEINKFYKNAISYMFIIGEDFIKNGQNGALFKMYLTMLFSGDIDLRQHNKPLLYYFVTKNIEFWKNDFIQHTLPSNFTGTENCLPYPTEPQESNQLNLKFLKYYAADMQGFNDYILWLNDTSNVGGLAAGTDIIQMQSIELDKYNLNHEKIYWLALVQEQCLKNINLTISNDDVMSTVIKHSKQLSDAFECHENIKEETCNYHLFSTLF